MFGRDSAAWIGKRVTLYPAEIQFEGNDLAIRVRGSPDIPNDIEFTLSLAKKKPRQVKLIKTMQQQKAAPKPASQAAPQPALAPSPPPPEELSTENWDGRYPPDDVPGEA